MKFNLLLRRACVHKGYHVPPYCARGLAIIRPNKGTGKEQSKESLVAPSQERRDLFGPFDHPLLRHFDYPNLFRHNFFENWPENFSKFPSMSTDVIEKDSEYKISCDLPGVDKKDIKITFYWTGNVLEISGERKEFKEEKDTNQTIHRKERYHGNFVRQLVLPDDVAKDLSGIAAKFENGVLNVSIPKQRPTSKGHVTVDVQ
ncbi:HSP20 family protein [Reticulomyxa filosa]|uniref:HSP20 family protein n=1 Tax=Reticulomyxa filosa TaxID=46433 RepID=X6NU91_RETFI|nr:HSP20 family protein [Reticulomyxa filosa]|eukprot:ETO29860.1 HSP20 family protein [Reticulomyxa filosa]